MPWLRASTQIPDLEFYDAHVHLGIHDLAGLEVVEEEMLGALAQVNSRPWRFR